MSERTKLALQKLTILGVAVALYLFCKLIMILNHM